MFDFVVFASCVLHTWCRVIACLSLGEVSHNGLLYDTVSRNSLWCSVGTFCTTVLGYTSPVLIALHFEDDSANVSLR